MKIAIDLVQDSHNTRPTDVLELSLSPINGEVNLAISGCDREVVVSLKQLATALEALENLQ